MHLLRNRDILGGVVLILIGVYFLIAGRDLDFGTLRRMGPGFLPTVTASVLTAFGVGIALAGLRRHVDAEAPALRPTLLILAAVACFAILVPRLGLMPAVAGSVIVAAFADPRHTLLTAVLLGAGAAVASWAVFILGLGLQAPAFTLVLR